MAPLQWSPLISRDCFDFVFDMFEYVKDNVSVTGKLLSWDDSLKRLFGCFGTEVTEHVNSPEFKVEESVAEIEQSMASLRSDAFQESFPYCITDKTVFDVRFTKLMCVSLPKAFALSIIGNFCESSSVKKFVRREIKESRGELLNDPCSPFLKRKVSLAFLRSQDELQVDEDCFPDDSASVASLAKSHCSVGRANAAPQEVPQVAPQATAQDPGNFVGSQKKIQKNDQHAPPAPFCIFGPQAGYQNQQVTSNGVFGFNGVNNGGFSHGIFSQGVYGVGSGNVAQDIPVNHFGFSSSSFSDRSCGYPNSGIFGQSGSDFSANPFSGQSGFQGAHAHFGSGNNVGGFSGGHSVSANNGQNQNCGNFGVTGNFQNQVFSGNNSNFGVFGSSGVPVQVSGQGFDRVVGELERMTITQKTEAMASKFEKFQGIGDKRPLADLMAFCQTKKAACAMTPVGEYFLLQATVSERLTQRAIGMPHLVTVADFWKAVNAIWAFLKMEVEDFSVKAVLRKRLEMVRREGETQFQFCVRFNEWVDERFRVGHPIDEIEAKALLRDGLGDDRTAGLLAVFESFPFPEFMKQARHLTADAQNRDAEKSVQFQAHQFRGRPGTHDSSAKRRSCSRCGRDNHGSSRCEAEAPMVFAGGKMACVHCGSDEKDHRCRVQSTDTCFRCCENEGHRSRVCLKQLTRDEIRALEQKRKQLIAKFIENKSSNRFVRAAVFRCMASDSSSGLAVKNDFKVISVPAEIAGFSKDLIPAEPEIDRIPPAHVPVNLFLHSRGFEFSSALWDSGCDYDLLRLKEFRQMNLSPDEFGVSNHPIRVFCGEEKGKAPRKVAADILFSIIQSVDFLLTYSDDGMAVEDATHKLDQILMPKLLEALSSGLKDPTEFKSSVYEPARANLPTHGTDYYASLRTSLYKP